MLSSRGLFFAQKSWASGAFARQQRSEGSAFDTALRQLAMPLPSCEDFYAFPRRRYRLGVRTRGSQPRNPGSIPGSATNCSYCGGLFRFALVLFLIRDSLFRPGLIAGEQKFFNFI